ncbi:hypothetical protein LCGC14_2753490 [marine sediment metagenome]|uniref:Helix-turn-helix type 11 domain-containing protein n=1 Tax=marine sediment metagenome TaxID=412755 RepID=A0A0F8Z123_9ZZZZ
MAKKSRINNIDSKIFASIVKARRPLSLGKLSKRTDISWLTIKNHVQKMEGLGVLKTQKTIRKTAVTVNPKFKESNKKFNLFDFID